MTPATSPANSSQAYQSIAPLRSLFSRSPLRGWGEIDASFGDEFLALDGSKLRRGEALPADTSRLPLVFGQVPIVGDMIPQTSWGASLANILTKTCWDGLRTPIFAARKGLCLLCGARPRDMDVHEVWSYAFPPAEIMALTDGRIRFGVQRLEGLMPVCTRCHECFHLGFANVRGKLDSTLARLRGLNRWSEDQVARYYEIIGARWEAANKVEWMLDMSKLAGTSIVADGLRVSGKWKVHADDPRVLYVPGPEEGTYKNVTALIGIRWGFPKEEGWRPVNECFQP